MVCRNLGSQSGTYSSQLNEDIDLQDIIDYVQLQEERGADTLPRTPPTTTPVVSIHNDLSTVEEERSSQLSQDSSSVKIAAGSLVDIASQLSEDSPFRPGLSSNNEHSKEKLEKKKSVSSEGSVKSRKGLRSSRESTPSPRKKLGKKAEIVNVDIEDEVNFTVVSRRSGKAASVDKVVAKSTASLDKFGHKGSPPRRLKRRASYSDLRVQYSKNPSRTVDSSISYAQIASTSVEPTVNIPVGVDRDTALLSLKEPEPERVTERLTNIHGSEDSLGSVCEGPIVFETELTVHRAAERDTPETAASETASSPSGGISVHDTPLEIAEKFERFQDKIIPGQKQICVDIDIAPLVQPEIFGDELEEVQEIHEEAVQETSVESGVHQVPTKSSRSQSKKFEGAFLPSPTTADVSSDIFECPEFEGYEKLENKSTVSGSGNESRFGDIEYAATDTGNSDAITPSSESNPSTYDSVSGDVRVGVESASSSQSFSSPLEGDPKLLGYNIEDLSHDSLEKAARQRKISENLEDPVDCEEELETNEDSRLTRKYRKTKGKKKSAEQTKILDEVSSADFIKNEKEAEEYSSEQQSSVDVHFSEQQASVDVHSSEQQTPLEDHSTEHHPSSEEYLFKQLLSLVEESSDQQALIEDPSEQEDSSEQQEDSSEQQEDSSQQQEDSSQQQEDSSQQQEDSSQQQEDSSQQQEDFSQQQEDSSKQQTSVDEYPSKQASVEKQTSEQQASVEKQISEQQASVEEQISEQQASLERDISKQQVSVEEQRSLIVSEVIEEEEKVIREEEEVENESVFTFPSQGSQKRTPIWPNFLSFRDLACKMRVLRLDVGSKESVLHSLEKNWILRFEKSPALFGGEVKLYCNFPRDKYGHLTEFDRKKYQLLEWTKDLEEFDDSMDYIQFECTIPGTFHYHFIVHYPNKPSVQGSGYFTVSPKLLYGEDKILPLNAIQCQTVISKNLGSISTWQSKLKVTKETGYNMIHFTPVQELGASKSGYCINDQMKLNPIFKKDNGQMPTWEELGTLTETLRKEWKVLSICDVVLNHTANETPWIKEHTEATYNCLNCKYMRPAYLIDAALAIFERDVSKGLYESRGIPTIITEEEHLTAVRHELYEVLNKLKIHQMYSCDVDSNVIEFMKLCQIQKEPHLESSGKKEDLIIIQDPEYRRFKSTIDMELALKTFNILWDANDVEERVNISCMKFLFHLIEINEKQYHKVKSHLDVAVDNIISGIRHWRVKKDGPRLGKITPQNPLIGRYFTDYCELTTVQDCEEIMYSNNGKFLMAHNGWVMNSDPLVNFANPESNVYLRRELIPWGDSVKLRYGEQPSDSPFLWNKMKEYVELTAKTFHGVRLDNCHSTPLVVAEYMLDCARKVRHNLYIVAELFTNEEAKDNIFVNRLGITSLIREAMSANNTDELGRLVYRFGGKPIGSFFEEAHSGFEESVAHALFFDQTHDNPSPVEKTSIFNMLPTAAFVNMACCGSGSNRGYDELVPHQIDVVTESREYSEWGAANVSDNPKYTSLERGIIKVKKILNDLHFKMEMGQFNEVFVYQMQRPREVIAITRHSPITHERIIMVAYTAFWHPQDNHCYIESLNFEGEVEEIILEATLKHADSSNGGSTYARPEKFKKSDCYINGLSEYVVHMQEHIQLKDSEVLEETLSRKHWSTLNFKNFKPGSIIILKVRISKLAKSAVSHLNTIKFPHDGNQGLASIIAKLELSDLNRILYRCDQEEREEGKGFDTYYIPGQRNLVYAGLQGVISRLRKVKDQGDPMCDNIRKGNWLIDYIYQRLELDEGTKELGRWIREHSSAIKALPEFLKPAYFNFFFDLLHEMLQDQAFDLMTSFVRRGSKFVQALSLGSIQFAAHIKSADLPKLSPNINQPRPPTRKDENGEELQVCVSLSAGLPHFSVGYMRNWGRDTFIALRGLFILTGRYDEARYHILAYAGCLRHGLIPNLLDGGRKPRYNCRDAVWWWLYCIKCYVQEVPNGEAILNDKVSRIFPTDDSPAQQPGVTEQSLQDVMQEALTRHFEGVTFKERNAGREIDEHMKDNGFEVRIGVLPDSGFVFGGNADNCGTWMDKMGSSAKAGNKGKPATPRDGSACEIVGLCKAVVHWLAYAHDKGQYSYLGVEKTSAEGIKTKWTFKQWSDLIQANFEKAFWIEPVPTADEYRPDLINKRGIYKDSVGSSNEWTDFQLRCNIPIVMVVAPELFNPQHAWMALENTQKYLLGPLGMKTLDPEDWAYRADYDNSNDSCDGTVAQGFNYHQGPEWVWPIGFFLRAKLYFAKKNNKSKETEMEVENILGKHFEELENSEWKGLPELTNSNGVECRDSSNTQAWSMSCVLEALHDLIIEKTG